MELRKRIQKGSTTEKSSTKRNIAEKNTAKEKIIEHSLAERGITLVALVVTIIILIILATITINFAFGEEGLIQKAQEAKNLTEGAVENEQKALNSLMDEYANIMAEEGTPPDEPDEPYVDDSIAVAPQISEGMTPVKWNGSKWVKTTATDEEWYNYGKKEWANVVLVGENGKDADGDEDVFKSDGTLNEESNYSMLVWIPRYAYKITGQYATGTSGAGRIEIVFIDTANKGKDGSKTYSTTYPNAEEGASGGMSDYVVHPAFDYGGRALAGFWVGKYETSHTDCTTDASTGQTGTDVTTLTPQIKAGVTSWRNIRVTNIFTVCTEMNKEGNPYGLSSNDSEVDPHMMKNSEWGAVAYLSQNATYGKGKEVWINPNSNFITGQAGTGVSVDRTTSTDNYNEGNGPQASTTGNVTGVYDMSGGAYEYVAGYVNNSYVESGQDQYTYGQSLIDSVNRGNTKYADVYKVGSSDSSTNNQAAAKPTPGQGTPTKDTGHFGDAVYETADTNIAWYDDYSIFPYSSYYSPFFVRGGFYGDGSSAGLFSFVGNGGNCYANFSFRVVAPVL